MFNTYEENNKTNTNKKKNKKNKNQKNYLKDIISIIYYSMKKNNYHLIKYFNLY